MKPNARWSIDFVYDQFANGRRLRVLNIVGDVTKECLGAIPDTSIFGRRVARELAMIVERRGKPGSIVSTMAPSSPVMPCWLGARTPASTGTSSRQASRSRMPSRASTVACAMNCSTRPCSSILTTPGRRLRAGCRLQQRPSALFAEIPHPAAYACHIQRNGRSAAQPSTSSANRPLLHLRHSLQNLGDSNCHWMKIQWQVKMSLSPSDIYREK